MHNKEIYDVEIASYGYPTMTVTTLKSSEMDPEGVYTDTTRVSAAIYFSDRLPQKSIDSAASFLDEKQDRIDPYHPNNRSQKASKEFVIFYTDRYLSNADTTVVTRPDKGSLRFLHYEQSILCNRLKCSYSYSVASLENKKNSLKILDALPFCGYLT